MPIKVKVLAMDQLTSTTTSKPLYTPATTAPAQTAIVKTMRFANLSGITAKLDLFFVPNGSTYPTNARRISPKNLLVSAGAVAIDEKELTLGSGDTIYAVSDATGGGSNWFDCVISGVERDA